jgi:hypothetical protein
MVGSARIEEGADVGRNDRQARVIWAAGFFDGEGSVGMSNLAKSGNRSLLLSVGQLVREPLDVLVDLYGGSIHLDTGQDKPIYRWRVGADKAANAIEEMLPYLRVKGEQAVIGIEFQRGKASRPRWYASDDERRAAARERTRDSRARANGEDIPIHRARPVLHESEKNRWVEYMARIQKARP